MIRGRSVSNKCIHDYLSFTFSPRPLMKMKSLAKTGAIIKTPRPVGAERFSVTDTNVNDAFASEMSDMLFDAMGSADLIAADFNYNDAYSDIVHHYGVQLLDALCCAEIDTFIAELNSEMTPKPQEQPRFSYKQKNGGMFGYSYSAFLLIDGANAGVIAWGAENGGCMVSFTGDGCEAIDPIKLHGIVSNIPGFKITRVDLALDDYSGENFSALGFRDIALNGGFSGRGRPPKYTYIESGHIQKTGNKLKPFGFKSDLGCSFYVGSRTSGKIFRGYEKGKQMESEQYPNWQRAEVEIRSKDRIIPLDVLLNPDAYFAGAYPALAGLCELVNPCKIKTFKNKFKSDKQRVISSAATHAGRVINYLFNVEGADPKEICYRLTRHLGFDDIPHRLIRPINYDLISTNGTLEPAF